MEVNEIKDIEKRSRSDVRDSAFKLVFEHLLRGDDIQELYDIADEIDEINVDDDVKNIVDGTIAHAEEIDRIIESYSRSRKLSRISKINHSILRIAVYECLYDEKTPDNAAISEAVKLADTYTYREDINFINGVLGAFSRDRQNGEKNA
ncbi:MAG: transcription antitermination factor NusB [Ruminococcus sp.]|nr:transcription antitermination factor NusB [Ruminococcus sp.]MDE6784624.1 transcription antitermination factor NusB [Ruminococcus sp.]